MAKHYVAKLTEVRKDGMQKWEREDLSKDDHMRYIWLAPFQSHKSAVIGSKAHIEFNKGTVQGHYSLYFVKELLTI